MATMPRAGRVLKLNTAISNTLNPALWLINRHKNVVNGIANGISVFRFSSSPDNLNYERWHRNDNEDAPRTYSTHQYDKVFSGSINDSKTLQDTSVSTGKSWHANATAKSNVDNNALLELPRTSVLMELSDRVGALHDVLKY